MNGKSRVIRYERLRPRPRLDCDSKHRQSIPQDPTIIYIYMFTHNIIEGTNILDKDITAMLGCTHTNKENESKESINNNNKYTRQRHYYYLL